MRLYVKDPNKRKTVYDIVNIFYEKDQIIFDKEGAEILIGDDFLLLGEEKVFYKSNLDLKTIIYKYLAQKTSYRSPWGILTGSKPSKLLKKYSPKEIKDKYLVSDEKIELLEKIKENQENLSFDPKAFNLYINIPFCPTRCDYCSYPTIVGSHVDRSIYIDYLLKELEGLKLPKKVHTIYIGGGTPSFLIEKDLIRLLKVIESKFSFEEFTFEAGREDSLNEEKLEIFKDYGVNRISLNPQTFNKSVIEKTGRIQDIKEFIKLYNKANDLGLLVNMDFIVGLFGETRESFKKNFEILEKLKAHNITFHALAQKVGSKYFEENVLGSKKESLLISQDIKEFAEKNSYKPYYLYRQKNIISNLENIGFERNDTPSAYNILINEELENIVGLGMNANSKLMDKNKYRNAKNLRDYYATIEDEIKNKNKMLEKFINGGIV